MMRAVVDTNVLVSAVILPGSQLGKILFHIRNDSFTLLYHSATLAELVRVLESNRIQKRFQPTSTNIQTAIELVVRYGELIDITQQFALCRDPKDNIFWMLRLPAMLMSLSVGIKTCLHCIHLATFAF